MLRQTNPIFHQRWLARLAVSAVVLLPMSALGQALPTALAGQEIPEGPYRVFQSIEVFTTAGEPVTNVPEGVAVIELDAPARLDGEISQGLPDDSEAAKAVIQERMQSPEWQQVVERYGDLYVGVARAWLLRVEKVPAVVANGEYVVYGQSDVRAALSEILEQLGGEL